MRATLTTEELSAQVLFWHMGLQSRSQRIPERAEPFEVERLVAKLASKIYDTVQADEREIIEAARRAGMAIYMMAGYGFDFLEVCWRVGEREAQILRRVTPDVRECGEKCQSDHRTRVATPSEDVAAVQLVAYAELSLVTNHLEQALASGQYEDSRTRSFCKSWVLDQLDLVRSFGHLRPIAGRVGKTREQLEQLDDRLAPLRERRRAAGAERMSFPVMALEM